MMFGKNPNILYTLFTCGSAGGGEFYPLSQWDWGRFHVPQVLKLYTSIECCEILTEIAKV